MYKVIGVDQKEYGPVSAEELRRWIAEGRANAQTLVQAEGTADWKPLTNLPEGATNWKPLASFPEFTSALNAALPSPPPPLSTAVPGYYAAQRTNSMAVTGFIFGILSLFCGICCCVPIFPILGLIFSGIGLNQVNNNPLQRGRGFAITGIVLSLIAIFLFMLFMAFGTMDSLFDTSGGSGL
jgi:Domain of unknown function (DUF4190)/GYF domain 2